jgi:FXSXX-COOH protein
VSLVDIRDVSLAELPDLDADILAKVIKRVLPETPREPDSAFNSAI